MQRRHGSRRLAATAALMVGLLLSACEDDEATMADAPATAPAADAGAVTTSTVAAPAADDGSSTDDAVTVAPTTLPTVPAATSPAATTAPDTMPVAPAAGATIVIEAGDMSLTQTGGTCSVIDGTTYIFTGSQDSTFNGTNAVIMWGGDVSAPVEPTLTWQLDADHPAVSGSEIFSLTIAADGKSGTFGGEALVAKAGQDGYYQPIVGSFTCDG